eukprot:g4214.t1
MVYSSVAREVVRDFATQWQWGTAAAKTLPAAGDIPNEWVDGTALGAAAIALQLGTFLGVVNGDQYDDHDYRVLGAVLLYEMNALGVGTKPVPLSRSVTALEEASLGSLFEAEATYKDSVGLLKLSAAEVTGIMKLTQKAKEEAKLEKHAKKPIRVVDVAKRVAELKWHNLAEPLKIPQGVLDEFLSKAEKVSAALPYFVPAVPPWAPKDGRWAKQFDGKLSKKISLDSAAATLTVADDDAAGGEHKQSFAQLQQALHRLLLAACLASVITPVEVSSYLAVVTEIACCYGVEVARSYDDVFRHRVAANYPVPEGGKEDFLRLFRVRDQTILDDIFNTTRTKQAAEQPAAKASAPGGGGGKPGAGEKGGKGGGKATWPPRPAARDGGRWWFDTRAWKWIFYEQNEGGPSSSSSASASAAAVSADSGETEGKGSSVTSGALVGLDDVAAFRGDEGRPELLQDAAAREIGPRPLFIGEPVDDRRLWLRDLHDDSDVSVATEVSTVGSLPDPRVNADDWRGRKFGPAVGSAFRQKGGELAAGKQRGMYWSVEETDDPEEHFAQAAAAFLQPEGGTGSGGLPRDLDEACTFAAQASEKEIADRLSGAFDSWQGRAKIFEGRRVANAARLDVPHMLHADVLEEILSAVGAGGRNFTRRLREGSRLIGIFDEPGVFPRKRGRNKKPKRLDIRCKRDLVEHQDRILEEIKRISERQGAEETLGVGPGRLGQRLRRTVKVRGCQNANRSGVNTFVEVRTPVALDTVDTAATLVQQFVERLPEGQKDDAAMGKKDHRHAYKHFGLHPKHRRYAVSVAIDPQTGRLVAFVSLVEYFGAEACVFNYNTASRVTCCISRRLLGIPLVAFYDDYFFVCRRSVLELVRRFFSRFWSEVIHQEFRLEKDEFGRRVKFLGIFFELLAEANGAGRPSLELSLGPGRKKKICDQIDSVLRSDTLLPGDAAVLAGRLGAATAGIFGRCGRCFLHPIHRRIYNRQPAKKLSGRLREALRWWRARLSEPKLFRRLMRLGIGRAGRPRAVVYSDASLGKLGGMCFVPDESGHQSSTRPGLPRGRWFQFSAPSTIAAGMQILPYETEAWLLCAHVFADLLRDRFAVFFIDNSTLQGAAVRGWSEDEATSAMVGDMWTEFARLGCDPWMERVASDANGADSPSRGELWSLFCGDEPRVGKFLSKLPGISSLAELVGVSYDFLPKEAAALLSRGQYAAMMAAENTGGRGALDGEMLRKDAQKASQPEGKQSIGEPAGRGVPLSFDEALDLPEVEHLALVESLEADFYAANSKGPQAVAWRKWEAICRKKGWQANAGWVSEEQIKLCAAILRTTTPQSAATYLSHIKMACGRVRALPPLLENVYALAFRACERCKKAPEQDLPFTLDILRKLDRAASTEADVITLRGCVFAWFLLARPDELADMKRTVTEKEICVKIPHSKTDTKNAGVSVRFYCICGAVKGFKNCKPCPVHVVGDELWGRMQKIQTASWRQRLYRLVEDRAGIVNTAEGRRSKLYSLYSSRVGGAQAAIVSLGRETMQILGRWASDVALHYESSAVLNPPADTVVKWPLVSGSIMVLGRD